MFSAPQNIEEQMSIIAEAFNRDRLAENAQESALQRHLIQIIKGLIEDEQLGAGALLPSTRELCSQLNVSRATVVRTYKDLMAQGYIEGRSGSGTFVRAKSRQRGFRQLEQEMISLSQFACVVNEAADGRLLPIDFPEMNYGCAPRDLLPLKQWRQAVVAACKDLNAEDLNYVEEPFGYRPLREALCGYLERSRTVSNSADNLIVCNSSTYLLHLVGKLLVKEGDEIAFPEPGAMYARTLFESMGATIRLIPADENGLDVAALSQIQPAPHMVYINSTHHNPTGATLSTERRALLVQWAQTHSAVIIDDDADGEYQLVGSRKPPLQFFAHRDSIIYIGNFWRTLYPLVNVGFMLIPSSLVPVFTDAWHSINHSFVTQLPLIDQVALCALLNSNEYEKYLAATSATYASRWRSCVHNLTLNFPHSSIEKNCTSNHVFVHLNSQVSDQVVIEQSQACGVPFLSAAPFYADGAAGDGRFIVPFSFLTEAQIADSLRALRDRLPQPSAPR